MLGNFLVYVYMLGNFLVCVDGDIVLLWVICFNLMVFVGDW